MDKEYVFEERKSYRKRLFEIVFIFFFAPLWTIFITGLVVELSNTFLWIMLPVTIVWFVMGLLFYYSDRKKILHKIIIKGGQISFIGARKGKVITHPLDNLREVKLIQPTRCSMPPDAKFFFTSGESTEIYASKEPLEKYLDETFKSLGLSYKKEKKLLEKKYVIEQ